MIDEDGADEDEISQLIEKLKINRFWAGDNLWEGPSSKRTDTEDPSSTKTDTGPRFIPSVSDSFRHANKIEKMWSNQIYKMRKEDREAFLDELHGVQSQAAPETQATIQWSLEKMEQEISKMVIQSSSDSSNAAGNLTRSHLIAVEELNSKYVVAPEFRIRFLRAEFFDAKKAAVRYLRNLNIIYKYFGEISLRRPLQMSDLSDVERGFLRGGQMQVLRSRDRIGRRISLIFAGKLRQYPKWERERAYVYLIYGVMAEDEETQIHGGIVVAICNLGGQFNGKVDGNNVSKWDDDEKGFFHRIYLTRKEASGPKSWLERIKASPLRFSSIHLCIPKGRIYELYKSMLLGLIPHNLRRRTRVHVGSHLEYCYDLAQFGIPVGDIPDTFSNGFVIKNRSLEKFLKARESIEKQRKMHEEKSRLGAFVKEDICPGVECPDSNCVIFGDRTTYNCPANIQFREYLRTKENIFCRSDAETFVTTESANDTDLDNLANTKKEKGLVRLGVKVLDEIINQVCMTSLSTLTVVNEAASDYPTTNFSRRKGFKFAIYDKKHEWYRLLDPIKNERDRIELRKRLSQTIRDERKRTTKSSNADQLKTVSRKGRQRGVNRDRCNTSSINTHQQDNMQQFCGMPTTRTSVELFTNATADAPSSCTRSSIALCNEIDRKRPKVHHNNFCQRFWT